MTQEKLTELGTKITEAGDLIRTLKTSGDDDAKSKIVATVAEMARLKKEYASLNNGVGHDGKPYVDTSGMSKKQAKKALDAAEKAWVASQGGGGTAAAPAPGKEVKKDSKVVAKGTEESKGPSKKAANKAAAKAKKAAMKSAGGANKTTSGGATGASAAAGHNNTPAAKSKKQSISSKSATLNEMELSFNPNAPLSQRPILTLALAVLLDIAPDLKLVSDHQRTNPTLGLSDGKQLVGDFAICRRLLTNGKDTVECDVESWLEYACSMSRQTNKEALMITLNHYFATNPSQTYLVGYELSVADLALYTAFGYNAIPTVTGTAASPAERWLDMMASSPVILQATQLAVGIVSNTTVDMGASPAMEELVPGMNGLEGALPGLVCTRFPPEPSGYLHIGHAKAVLLNNYYARRYHGRLIVRFDDTNPSKEKEEFQESILSDLGLLGVKPDRVTFTSDYFDTIRGYAIRLIEAGLAYMDDTPQEVMKEERMARQDSKHRQQSVEECLTLFHELCNTHASSDSGGKTKEVSPWCLRAKISMTSDNGTLRDPVLYRQNLTPHHRTLSTYVAYPTYDLACPIVDSLEGVSHALRTTEYNDRDEQYAWIQRALGLRRVRIHAFARLNFRHTVLSKRKLTKFVENGTVTGWDDPRFPTVRGVLRRGVNLEALRMFTLSQGASKNVVNMEWNKFWAENKKELDKDAKRYMAIDATRNVKMVMEDDVGENEYGLTAYHPKDPSLGKRVVRLGKEVMLEQMDTEGMVVGEQIVLMRWGVVEITGVQTNDAGVITELAGKVKPDGNVKEAKRKLSWLCCPQTPGTGGKNSHPTTIPCELHEFDNLITKEKLEETDNFEDFINPHTLATTIVHGDVGLRNLKKGEVIQLERRGYYRVDEPYVGNDRKPLVLFMVPDGKSKAMGGLKGKLAHH